MKTYFHFSILGFIFLFQQANGVRQEIQRPEELSTSVLKPLDDILQQYKRQIDEFETKKSQVKDLKDQFYLRFSQEVPEKCKTVRVLHHAKLFGIWDMEACLELTGDFKDAVLTALNATIFGANMSREILDNLNNLLKNCKEKTFFKEMKCYYSSFKELKNEIEELRHDVKPYIDVIKNIRKNMKKDFDRCVGIPYHIKGRLDMDIQSCMNEGGD